MSFQEVILNVIFERKYIAMRIFIFFSLFLSIISCSDKENKILPTQESITVSVYSSVTIQPDSLYQVFANVNGILEINLVTENELVEKGTPILQIINTSSKLLAENARLSFDLAQQNYRGNAAILNSVEKELNNAKLKFYNDSINYRRVKNLWEQHIGSKADHDAKKLAYELSANALEMARDNYHRTKNELQTQVNQANNTYKNMLVNTKDFTISSKINGKVYALYKNPGEVVSPLEPIASIGSATTFNIEMLVDEVDIVKIEEGQKVLITLDAYREDVFTATVSKIYPKKDERHQTFLVEASFENPPKTLYPGLSGEANIIIATKENALTIPREYLIDGAKVKTEQGIVRVMTGMENLAVVEIISGITKDTWVYKPEQ